MNQKRTPEKIEQLKALWPDHTLTGCAKIMGESRATISNWAKYARLPKKPRGSSIRPETAGRAKRATELRAEGKTWKEVAAVIGASSAAHAYNIALKAAA